MRPGTKAKICWIVAAVLGVAAVLLAMLAFVLIRDGAYPPEGTGSLGHVGMVIAGGIAGFLAVVLSLFVVYYISKARAAVGAAD